MTVETLERTISHFEQTYASYVQKISEDPWMNNIPFMTSGAISAALACAAKIVIRSTPYSTLFQAMFASCTAVHSALIAPFQSIPSRRTQYQSLVKSVLHVAWSLRAGPINAIAFEVLKRSSMIFMGENSYLPCFWDVVSIVTILPFIASPICSLTTGIMIVGVVALVSLVSKYIKDRSKKPDTKEQIVSIEIPVALMSSKKAPATEHETFFDSESSQHYFRPPEAFAKLAKKRGNFFPKRFPPRFFTSFVKFLRNFFKKGYFIAGTSSKVLESLLILSIACVKTSLRISKGDLQPVPGLQT